MNSDDRTALQNPRSRAWLKKGLILAGVGLGAMGCNEGQFFGSTQSVATGSSRLLIQPSVFLGNVACERGREGGLHSYVVDLIDPAASVTDAGPPEPLATSRAVSCDREVSFTVPSRRLYAVKIRGYDLAFSDPALNGPDAVEPRWLAECGTGSTETDAGVAITEGSPPILSVAGSLVLVRQCETLTEVGGGVLEIDLIQALGSGDSALVCGNELGQVATFTARIGEQSRTASCGNSVRFEGLSPGEYSVELTASSASPGRDAGLRDAGAEPVAQSCASDAGTASLDAGVTSLDAGQLPAPATDAGATDAGATNGGAIPGPGSPSSCPIAGDTAERAGVWRWQAECVGTVSTGQTSRAQCDVLQSVP